MVSDQRVIRHFVACLFEVAYGPAEMFFLYKSTEVSECGVIRHLALSILSEIQGHIDIFTRLS